MHRLKNFAIKGLLFLGAITLFAFSVHAQTGMPKELSCTETAFNFSFSLGSGWKLGASKMGPVEILNDNVNYNPLWRLNVKEAPAKNNWLPFSPGTFAVQKSKNLSLLREPQPLLPKLNFMAPLNYTKPGWQAW